MKYLLLLLVALQVNAAHPALMSRQALFAVDGGSFSYNAVEFSGIAGEAWLERDADFNGSADSKSGTISFWMRLDNAAAANELIMNDTQARVQIYVNSSELLRIEIANSAGTELIDFAQDSGSVANMVADTWYHVMASWDKSVETRRHLYINGTNCLTVNTFLSDDVDGNTDSIDYTQTDHLVAAYDNSGALQYDGCLSEFWWAPGQYIDLSVQGNRDKFISANRGAGGEPVNLGSGGATPTGTQPILYLKDATTSFPNNYGTGGNMVKKGTQALTACADGP
jgi:hypothetical protein